MVKNNISGFVAGTLLMLLVISIAGCNEKTHGLSVESDNFEKKSAVGLVKGKNYLMQFNKESSQYVYNFKRKCIRFQTDDQSRYVNAYFRDYPKDLVKINDVIIVELIYRESKSATETRLFLPMVLLKQEDKRYWLWSEEEKLGLIVDYELFGNFG